MDGWRDGGMDDDGPARLVRESESSDSDEIDARSTRAVIGGVPRAGRGRGHWLAGSGQRAAGSWQQPTLGSERASDHDQTRHDDTGPGRLLAAAGAGMLCCAVLCRPGLACLLGFGLASMAWLGFAKAG
ncbi:uncharacterized protein UV8b_05950 [Ustilaginoidea virens]|uniref:Uncharacterized protein n=1 Tax=Ustilaginoidea virens TaxID=1159556 RepID=A0A8E5MJ49_USTVR|nr:uncharacterized protein UV8b_05950 [Ustilaginoidea virens]QUC21707.1 hypothetical protein UV8b_05950 [Ustilaginoidea virens]